MIVAEGIGVSPVATSSRSVIAQTPIRLSKVPLGSNELRKYSAFGVPVLSAGLIEKTSWPPRARLEKCAKCTGLPPTRSDLENAKSWPPLNCGPRIENSSVLMYTLYWSMPMRGWSPKHGHPLPPGWVVSMRYSVQMLVGSPVVFTALPWCECRLSLLMKRISANHVFVVGSKWQRGSLVNSWPPSLKMSLMLNG